MFVRIKSTPNSPRKSVQLVESHRTDGKIRQRIVRHIGIAMDDDELQRLRDLGEYVKAKLEAESQPSLFPAEDLAQLAIEARKRVCDMNVGISGFLFLRLCSERIYYVQTGGSS